MSVGKLVMSSDCENSVQVLQRFDELRIYFFLCFAVCSTIFSVYKHNDVSQDRSSVVILPDAI